MNIISKFLTNSLEKEFVCTDAKNIRASFLSGISSSSKKLFFVSQENI